MIDPQMVEILACPLDGCRLHLADEGVLQQLNQAIAAGEVKTRLGRIVTEPLEAGLVTENGARVYPVIAGIPVLLVDEAIPAPAGMAAAAVDVPLSEESAAGARSSASGDDASPATEAAGPDFAHRVTAVELDVSRTVQSHYDAHHFDCMSDAVLEHVRATTLLGQVERQFDPRDWRCLIDVGCGASCRNVVFAQRYWGVQAIPVDLSQRTLMAARERVLAPFVNGSVLALPFRNEIADFVICTGVIHHTPNPRRAFHELARLLRPGGGMFLSVYNRNSIYYPIYTYVGGLFRTLSRRGFGWLLRAVFIPLYAAVYVPIVWLASRQVIRVPYAQAAADFDDKFLSPVAHFYKPREIEAWIEAEGLSCLDSGTHMAGMMLGFVIKRQESA